MAAPPPSRRPDPPPRRTNTYVPVIIGTALWAVAFVVLLTQHHDMAARGQGWWVWVALTAVMLGFWGMVLMWLHHRNVPANSDRQTRPEGTEENRPSKT